MATQLSARSVAAVAAQEMPFLLSRPPAHPDFVAALEAAALAEEASHDVRRNTRCRVSYFLCEVANQLRQRGLFDFAGEMPLSRYNISDRLDISLCKVKRVLALLGLSGVISTDGRTLHVLDWHRLCAVAHVDPARLNLAPQDDDDDYIRVSRIEDVEKLNLVTASGETACFV